MAGQRKGQYGPKNPPPPPPSELHPDSRSRNPQAANQQANAGAPKARSSGVQEERNNDRYPRADRITRDDANFTREPTKQTVNRSDSGDRSPLADRVAEMENMDVDGPNDTPSINCPRLRFGGEYNIRGDLSDGRSSLRTHKPVDDSCSPISGRRTTMDDMPASDSKTTATKKGDFYRPAIPPSVATDLRRAKVEKTEIPSTAFDLRAYNKYLREQIARKLLHSFRYGDGCINPSKYGSTEEYNLGLCYAMFMTRHTCENGDKCRWRHHPLSKKEKDWITQLEKIDWTQTSDGLWATPDIPVPGKNMADVHDAIKEGLFIKAEMVKEKTERGEQGGEVKARQGGSDTGSHSSKRRREDNDPKNDEWRRRCPRSPFHDNGRELESTQAGKLQGRGLIDMLGGEGRSREDSKDGSHSTKRRREEDDANEDDRPRRRTRARSRSRSRSRSRDNGVEPRMNRDDRHYSPPNLSRSDRYLTRSFTSDAPPPAERLDGPQPSQDALFAAAMARKRAAPADFATPPGRTPEHELLYMKKNETANLALGGKKNKKYGWMTAGALPARRP